jgi:hypothetical protein
MDSLYALLSNYVKIHSVFEAQEIPLREQIITIIDSLKITQADLEKDENIKSIILTSFYPLNDIDLLLPSTMIKTRDQKLKIRNMKRRLKTWYAKIESIVKEKNEIKALIIDEVDEDNSDGADFYAILGISKQANSTEIKDAYRKLCLLHHPDKGGDTKKVIPLN